MAEHEPAGRFDSAFEQVLNALKSQSTLQDDGALASVFGELMARRADRTEPEKAPQDRPARRNAGLEEIAALLPTLMQAASGKGELLKPEKVNLIRAFKPYLSQEREGEIDHAIRMASVAEAAKRALNAMGR